MRVGVPTELADKLKALERKNRELRHEVVPPSWTVWRLS